MSVWTNRWGIPFVETSGVTVGTENVVINFPNHAFRNTPYRGYVTIKVNTAITEGTTATLPVVFQANNTTLAVTNQTGEPATVEDFGFGNGYREIFYDKSSNVLQLI